MKREKERQEDKTITTEIESNDTAVALREQQIRCNTGASFHLDNDESWEELEKKMRGKSSSPCFFPSA
jgi:hypothetical protein